MKKNKTAKFLTFILLVLAMNTIYVLPYLMYTCLLYTSRHRMDRNRERSGLML